MRSRNSDVLRRLRNRLHETEIRDPDSLPQTHHPGTAREKEFGCAEQQLRSHRRKHETCTRNADPARGGPDTAGRAMLVLTRKPGESIRIGEDISIRVIGVQRRQVRFAIDAPREIPVHREEVYELIQKENREAAASTTELDPTPIWKRGNEGVTK